MMNKKLAEYRMKQTMFIHMYLLVWRWLFAACTKSWCCVMGENEKLKKISNLLA